MPRDLRNGELERDREGVVPAIKRFGPAVMVGVVAIVVLVLTLVTAVGFWFRSGLRADGAVAQGGEVVVEALSGAIASAEERLVAAAGLFRASDIVTQKEFALFAADVGVVEGMGGLGFIALVRSEDLDQYIEDISREIPDYSVFERDSEGGRVSVGPRSVYYPAQWFEPAGAFDRPHGFDSGSDPVRRAALERTAEADATIATPFLQLFSEDEDDGFILYRRVADPETGAIEGFTLAPMDLSELLATRIPPSIAEAVTWKVVDVTDLSTVAADVEGGWVSQISVGDRIWRVSVDVKEGSPYAFNSEAPLLVLMAGLTLSAAVATVTYLLYRRNETNRELQHLRDLTSAKDRFLASVSHELRTPLTGVLGFAELLRDNDPSLSQHEREEMITAVADQAFDLGNIIEDLLVSARAELDQLVIAKVPVCVQAQVAQVIEAYGIEVVARVKVIDHLAPLLRAVGDPGRVRQIIRNLITNARRYGGPSIEVRLNEAYHTIQVNVADNGPAIPEEASERIFLPYQRAQRSSGQLDSVGIGLGIARTLARLMGGDLQYFRRGDWNIFQLSLPSVSLQAVSLQAEAAAVGVNAIA
ncbi:MAG TPA: CHASE domain-containing protein [Acidimicrobiia bacterium]|nr:CHASE domain-containing protein [Acidimicrobiia bacterium]